MNLSDSIADALMLKQVATGSLSRADIVDAVDGVLTGHDVRKLAEVSDAPIFCDRPWWMKEAVAAFESNVAELAKLQAGNTA